MTVTQDLSFFGMISNASLLVQLVMALLLLVSAMSWTYIFRKMFTIRNAIARTTEFETVFWSGANLNNLYEDVTSGRRQRNGQSGALERIFEAGMEEYRKARQTFTGKDIDVSALLDGARRAMRAAYQREMDALESHLAFLASVGSVSPYIGLFGTVWGIMNSFRGLANVQQATLASVAPGIAEALVATAIGLFAAIPAVVAFNRYSHDIDRLAIRFESFIEEFSNILNRQAR
ncbi:MAG: protein TolQ [Burkholderiaceae bacterium]|jgi:biopolymer transport protein TolQ|nr:protein TolQ [Polynucleobacter sp.]MCF8188754.1 protein TolQ [Sulfuritalea sp.]